MLAPMYIVHEGRLFLNETVNNIQFSLSVQMKLGKYMYELGTMHP